MGTSIVFYDEKYYVLSINRSIIYHVIHTLKFMQLTKINDRRIIHENINAKSFPMEKKNPRIEVNFFERYN